MSDDKNHGHRVMLGDFRALTRDLPDDTLLVTGAHRDPGILGGTPVFRGTRVPVRILAGTRSRHGPPPVEGLGSPPANQGD